jgi:enoyl-CoA hydratase/carnithine racemase
MMRPAVLLETRAHVATITLQRPDARNAIDEALAAELRDACRAVIEDDSVYVCIVTGSGRHFSVTDQTARLPRTPEELAGRRVSDALAAIPKPLIAALNGDAIGQGLELALACDLRVASETARFALDHILHGHIPWDGGTQRLPRFIPRAIALELILTGKSISATEAKELGLLNEAAPAAEVLPRAKALAAKLAAMAPIAAAYVKEAAAKGMDMTLDQGLRLETDLAILLHTTHDRAEGLKSFLERRAPHFAGR